MMAGGAPDKRGKYIELARRRRCGLAIGVGLNSSHRGSMAPDRDQILRTLSAHRQELAQRFGVKQLSLFGSAARDQLREDSDVDLLVEFDGDATYDGYFKLQDYLQALLGRTVDLVTERGFKPRSRQHVQKDLVRIA
jgi:predicted nucleotidyltransferase